MSASERKAQASREAADSPVAWFAVLEHARRRHDPARARQATAELNRLGVRVRFLTDRREAAHDE